MIENYDHKDKLSIIFFSTHVILKNCQVVALFEFFLTNFISQHCPNGICKERNKVKSVSCSQKEVVLAVIHSILPDLLLKYPNLFLGYRTKTWKYMKNNKLKLNASCIPKAVISRDWQIFPTHPQLFQMMWCLYAAFSCFTTTMKNEPLSKDVVLALCELKVITDFHALGQQTSTMSVL